MASPANHYKIYPRPNSIPACDNFFWMLVWFKWLELFHYGRMLQPHDFVFPTMGANGVVQPGQPISHDTVQKWINESMAGAGIRGNFSTHCFRRGGAQYWFMFAPVGQRWTLAKVRWWGGWAEGEQVCLSVSQHSLHCSVFSHPFDFQRDTLIRYLLDELHAYETDYSDALAPISRGADTSLAGEHALVGPASTEELRSVAADVSYLRNDIGSVNNSLRLLTNVVAQAACTTSTALQLLDSSQRLATISDSKSSTSHVVSTPLHRHADSGGSNSTISTICSLSGSPGPATGQDCTVLMSQQRHPSTTPSTGMSSTASTSPPLLPTNGLVIPRVPVARPNGTTSPKNGSWKDIVEHWLVGDPDRGLKTPLKDWPKEWYQGANRRFASKYHQRATIALKFVNK
jgi:hypothetical protein